MAMFAVYRGNCDEAEMIITTRKYTLFSEHVVSNFLSGVARAPIFAGKPQFLHHHHRGLANLIDLASPRSCPCKSSTPASRTRDVHCEDEYSFLPPFQSLVFCLTLLNVPCYLLATFNYPSFDNIRTLHGSNASPYSENHTLLCHGA